MRTTNEFQQWRAAVTCDRHGLLRINFVPLLLLPVDWPRGGCRCLPAVDRALGSDWHHFYYRSPNAVRLHVVSVRPNRRCPPSTPYFFSHSFGGGRRHLGIRCPSPTCKRRLASDWGRPMNFNGGKPWFDMDLEDLARELLRTDRAGKSENAPRNPPLQLWPSSRRRAITWAWISAAPSKIDRMRASHRMREILYSSAKPLPP
jgi:hypothetical protein